jgi:hypothetical protein
VVTDEQVKLFRKKQMEGKNQEQAAAAAGLAVRTARRWESGPLPSETKQARSWRTRPDPFAEVWESEVVPLLEQDRQEQEERGRSTALQAKTVLGELRRRHPGQYPKGQLRTLQRRIREWRAEQGPPRDVVFPQEHPAGREAAFDFTHGDELGVTIAGVPFAHLWFTLKASHSKWLYAELSFGETWEAMCRGLQNGMADAGGVFAVWRHDNLSAATQDLKRGGGRALTTRYRELLEHYGAESTRIRSGKPNENGVAEKGNHLLKTAIDQALKVRGHRDFTTVASYVAFVREQIAAHNAEHAEAIEAEKAVLQALPSTRLPDYSEFETTVRSWSTIRVGGRTYSVPSRLIGHEVVVRRYPDHLEVRRGQQALFELPRLRGGQDVRIDYRHVIWSLVRKPGAFARYRYREELFPSLTFRRAYDRLVEDFGGRADIEYVRILHLAASTMERLVEQALEELLAGEEGLDYAKVKALAAPEPVTIPEVTIGEVDLKRLDGLLGGAR